MDKSFRFCILLVLGVLIPMAFMIVPLYLRHKVFVSTYTAVATSDFHVLHHRVSTVWCEAQTVSMNSTFNSYLMNGWPQFENSTRTYFTTKHLELHAREKEYWGFYLPRGSVLTVATCARFDGAHLSVVKGKKSLKRCARAYDDASTESSTSAHADEEEDDEEEDDEEDDDDEDGEETDDDDSDDESSFSSSEEDFDYNCRRAVVNRTLPPLRHCVEDTWYPNFKTAYAVPHTDYYYLIFTGGETIHFPNHIFANISIQKPVYNVKHSINQCYNVSTCRLPLNFAADQHVVLEVPARKQWTTDVAHTACEPRTAIYFPFYLGVPISILFFAFRGNNQKR